MKQKMKTIRLKNKRITKNIKKCLVEAKEKLIRVNIEEEEVLREKHLLINEIINTEQDLKLREGKI